MNAREYADAALRMILEDVRHGLVPDDAASFSELHDYVDANEYVIGVPVDDDYSLINAVTDLVDADIKSGALRVHGLTVTVSVSAKVFAEGWASDAGEFAASVRATLSELQGDDGGAYRPTVEVVD